MEYSLADIIAILMKRFMLIAVCTFLGLFTFYFFNRFVLKPMYTASVQMYVNPNDISASTDLNELNYAQQVTTTYVYFLKTNVFYEMVVNKIDLNYDVEQLTEMTTIEPINNTEIFQISVTSTNPSDSYSIVKAMQEVAPELIKSIKNTAKISIVDPVILPIKPSGPKVFLNTLIGGLLGFLLSIIASFLWEILDVKLKSREELIKKYKYPVIGAIPNYSSNNLQKYKILNLIPWIKKRYIDINRNNSKIDEEKKFEVSEAYNELRANLKFTLLKNGCKKIVISSPVPEDGKSTTSTNIALTIAQMGARVLLMDCDLRKGKIHNYFKIKSKPGISDVLSGMINEMEIIRRTKYENLYVIPMGTIPPNPTELLASKQMEEVILRLEKNYDYIIIDSPPVNVVSDALSLVKMVDGVVIVVREGVTSHPNINNAMTKYILAEANILGFVINGISLDGGKKSKYQNYYYYKSNND